VAGRRWWWVVVLGAGACAGPTSPGAPIPPTVKLTTAPVIRSIAAPTARVEAGQDIAITAVVEDAETPLNQLSYVWAANAGTFTGSGPAVTWRHAAGLTAGVDVVITLTVIDKYKAVENNVIVDREYRVVGQAAPFRVHDSAAEMKELARKFLLDLFGNSNIPPIACVVDFSESGRCARGKADELNDITDNRALVEIKSARIHTQQFVNEGPDAARVINFAEFFSVWRSTGEGGFAVGDFIITGIYEQNRWWICESTFDPVAGSGGLFELYRKRSRSLIGGRVFR
jgi:hypothetical protein